MRIKIIWTSAWILFTVKWFIFAINKENAENKTRNKSFHFQIVRKNGRYLHGLNN
jgi:hypothetical protein